METQLRNQHTKPTGPKIEAARNRAPIIQRAFVHKRAQLSRRLILLEVTTKGIINHESRQARTEGPDFGRTELLYT